MAGPEPLLDAATLRHLERFSLAALDGLLAGVFGSAAAASGANGGEFADHRPYVEGDDLRRIDWNVYARLEQTVVRLSPSEAPVGLAVLVDASASMTGAPALMAARTAATLAAIALLHGDMTQVVELSAGTAVAGPRHSGPQSLAPALAALEAIAPRGTTDLTASLHAAPTGAALSVLITDGLIPPDQRDAALRAFSRTAHATALIHVLDPELDAPDGPVDLIDRETGAQATIDLDAATRARHAERTAALSRDLAAACAARSIHYMSLSPTVDPLSAITALPIVQRR